MSENNNPTGRQIAAARALAGIGQVELAERANISAPTVRRMEADEGPITGMANNVAAVIAVLQSYGVEFLNAGDVASGVGVVLRKPEE